MTAGAGRREGLEAEPRLPGNVYGGHSAVSSRRCGMPISRQWVYHPEFISPPPLTVCMRKLRSRGKGGLAKVTLLLQWQADPDLEVTCKPKSKRGSKQTHLLFFQRTFCSKPPFGSFIAHSCFSVPDLAISGGKHAAFCKCVQITNMPVMS